MEKDEQALWKDMMNPEELRLRGLSRSPHLPPESLRSLANVFCFDGSMPPNKKEGIVKELLRYCIIDVFAHMNGTSEALDHPVLRFPRQDVIRAVPQLVRLTFLRLIVRDRC